MDTEKIEIRKLLASKVPKVGEILFIAVDGHGGSGKSTFATWLGKNLSAEVVRQDDFASWDNPLNWWPLVIEKVFTPIQNGSKTISYARSKWWENHNPEPVVDQPVTNQPVTNPMILEGVSSSRREFRDYISLSIFVDTPEGLCLQRGIERDMSTGKTREELTQIWNEYLKEENEYIERDQPKIHADIVIDGTRPFDSQIDF